nr:hypothetical protein Q903MT_gene6376 [Picea sitchensis]
MEFHVIISYRSGLPNRTIINKQKLDQLSKLGKGQQWGKQLVPIQVPLYVR